MNGYVVKKGARWYAVVYEGLDPVTGRERRSWHPAGFDRADAEKLAARLASERNGANDEGRSLTLGAYLTGRWLPGKRVALATSTWDGYPARSTGTSSRPSDRSGSVGFAPTTSKRSTSRCCTPPTADGRSHPRPCSRPTSSFAAR